MGRFDRSRMHPPKDRQYHWLRGHDTRLSIAGAVLLGIIAVVIGLLVSAVAVILAFYDSDDLKHLAAGAASAALGAKWRSMAAPTLISVGNADLRERSDGRQRRVGEGQGSYMAEVAQLDVAIDVWELLKGRILIPEMDIAVRALDLEKNADGEANWRFATGAEAVAAAPSRSSGKKFR